MRVATIGRVLTSSTTAMLVICLCGCAPATYSFTGTWTDGVPAQTTLTITSSGAFTGQDVCESFRGKGSISGDTFRFGSLTLTGAKACPYTGSLWLGDASTARISGNTLTVCKRGGAKIGTLHRH